MQQKIPASELVITEQQPIDNRSIEINIVTIVKNDVSIKRMIDLFMPLVNRFFILDNISTDDTLTIIQDKIFNEHMPIVHFEQPFENFVYSKNFILNKAYTYLRNYQDKKQVIIFVNADEFLQNDEWQLWKRKLQTIQLDQIFNINIEKLNVNGSYNSVWNDNRIWVYNPHFFRDTNTAWHLVKRFLVEGFLCQEIIYDRTNSNIIGFKTLDPATIVSEIRIIDGEQNNVEIIESFDNFIMNELQKLNESKYDYNKYTLTYDFSGGPKLYELITPPLKYQEGIDIINLFYQWINQYGKLNDKTSLHITLSFSNHRILNLKHNIEGLNKLKFILDFDENYIYQNFPTRKHNVFARSIKDIVKTNNHIIC